MKSENISSNQSQQPLALGLFKQEKNWRAINSLFVQVGLFIWIVKEDTRLSLKSNSKNN